MEQLKIGELSERVGLTTTTIRYYEQIGLVENTKRGENGYRLYDEETANRLLFIKRAKQFGLSLEDIKELVLIRSEGRCPCRHMQQKIGSKIQEIEDQIREMESFKLELERYYHNFKEQRFDIGKKPLPLFKVKSSG
jgi:MerR family copper efflux transcriptional regulator